MTVAPALALTILVLAPLILAQPTAADGCVLYNANNSVCTQCLPGLYLEYFFCVPCAPLCECSSNQNYCEACLNITVGVLRFSAYRSGGYCTLCNSTMRNCLECYNQLECKKCYNGRYVVADGFCSNHTCTYACQICRNSTNCELCKQGHFLYGNGTCSQQKCGGNCSLCKTQTQCKVCVNGYFPEAGECTPCMPNCIACSSTTNCLSCAPAYMYVNQSCQNTQVSNCIEYTGGFESPTCLVCEPGYYNAAGSCTQCSGCTLCTQAFLCQTDCLEGYTRFNYACLPLWEQQARLGVVLVLLAVLFIWI